MFLWHRLKVPVQTFVSQHLHRFVRYLVNKKSLCYKDGTRRDHTDKASRKGRAGQGRVKPGKVWNRGQGRARARGRGRARGWNPDPEEGPDRTRHGTGHRTGAKTGRGKIGHGTGQGQGRAGNPETGRAGQAQDNRGGNQVKTRHRQGEAGEEESERPTRVHTGNKGREARYEKQQAKEFLSYAPPLFLPGGGIGVPQREKRRIQRGGG